MTFSPLNAIPRPEFSSRILYSKLFLSKIIWSSLNFNKFCDILYISFILYFHNSHNKLTLNFLILYFFHFDPDILYDPLIKFFQLERNFHSFHHKDKVAHPKLIHSQ